MTYAPTTVPTNEYLLVLPIETKVVPMTASMIEAVAEATGYRPRPNDILFVNRPKGNHNSGVYTAVMDNDRRLTSGQVEAGNNRDGAVGAFVEALAKNRTRTDSTAAPGRLETTINQIQGA